MSSGYLGRDFTLCSVENLQCQDVWSANASASWMGSRLALLGALNYSHSSTSDYEADAERDRQQVLTARLMAHLDCGKGWRISLTEVFRTGARTATTRSDDEWYAALAVSKGWKGVDVTLRWDNFLERDFRTRHTDCASYSWLSPHQNMLRLSATYRF